MKKFYINLLVFVAASALLFFACDKKEATKLTVLPEELTFKADDADEKLVDVSSNVKNWTVTPSDRWIHIEELSDGFYVSVEKYTETSRERTGSITVKAGESKSETVNVVQLPAELHTLSVNPATLTFLANETGTKPAVIVTNAPVWDYSSPPGWLTLNKSGNSLMVTVSDVHSGPLQRSSSITITAGNATPVVLTVEQEAPVKDDLSVTTTNIHFPACEISNKTATITTSAASWNYSSAPDWLTVSKSGNTLTVTPRDLNKTSDQREANIRITAGTADPVDITVTQAKCEQKNTLTVSDEIISFEANETTVKTATITTDAASWDANPTNVDWLNIELTDFTLSVNPKNQNTGTSERSITITVTAGNADPVNVVVKQAAATPSLTVSPTLITFPAGDIALRTATITTNAASWSFLNTSAWLTVGRSGNTLTVTPTGLNKTSSRREAIINITAGTATPVSLTVRQEVTPDDPFDDIVRSTYTATGTPLSGVEYPAKSSWKGDVIPFPDNPDDRYYAITNWADITGYPLWVNYEDGKLFLDNSSICKDDGTYVYHYTVGYLSGSTFTSAPSSHKYEVKYNKSTKTLDFTGTYNGYPAVVILRRVNKSTQVGTVLTDLGLSNAKLVLTPVSSITPSNVSAVKVSDAPARKSGKVVVHSEPVIIPLDNVKSLDVTK